MNNTTQQPDTNNSTRIPWLEQRIKTKCLELFGEEHLLDDMPLLTDTQPLTKTERINRIQIDKAKITIQFEKAMAAYKREKEATITRYNFEKEMQIPPTLNCRKKNTGRP